MQVGCGPQQREFRKEILQAMQVGVWALTQKIHFIEFYIYVPDGQSEAIQYEYCINREQQ